MLTARPSYAGSMPRGNAANSSLWAHKVRKVGQERVLCADLLRHRDGLLDVKWVG